MWGDRRRPSEAVLVTQVLADGAAEESGLRPYWLPSGRTLPWTSKPGHDVTAHGTPHDPQREYAGQRGRCHTTWDGRGDSVAGGTTRGPSESAGAASGNTWAQDRPPSWLPNWTCWTGRSGWNGAELTTSAWLRAIA